MAHIQHEPDYYALEIIDNSLFLNEKFPSQYRHPQTALELFNAIKFLDTHCKSIHFQERNRVWRFSILQINYYMDNSPSSLMLDKYTIVIRFSQNVGIDVFWKYIISGYLSPTRNEIVENGLYRDSEVMETPWALFGDDKIFMGDKRLLTSSNTIYFSPERHTQGMKIEILPDIKHSTIEIQMDDSNPRTRN